MTAFSKRHREALADQKLDPQLGEEERGRIRRLMERHNQSYVTDDGDGFTYRTDVMEDLRGALCDLYGSDRLPVSGDAGGLADFLEKAHAEHVFDAVELFEPPHQDHFRGELNELLGEEGAAWRMLDGAMVLLDATFAREELAARTDGTLRGLGFDGAAAELRRARTRLTDGESRAAIHQAGTSFESVAMALLGKEHGKSAKLLQELNRDGYFDALPTRLREPFVREVLEAMPWMRNHLGGHGQGQSEVQIPPPYAELAVDLAAALSHFLIRLKLDRDGPPEPVAEEDSRADAQSADADFSDVPDFSITTGSEDDIPF